MLSTADKLFGGAGFIFQQDLAPAHTAKGTKNWFSDHGVIVLDWPVNLPDLQPIENQSMGCCQEEDDDSRSNNADDLKAAINTAWASITPQQGHSLIPSILHHIHAKGGPTKC